MIACASRCVSRPGAIPSRARRSSTVRASRRPKLAASVDSTGGKNTRGRKRHILVDTMGNLLAVLVQTAGWSDLEGGTYLLLAALHRFCTLLKVWADQAYRGDLGENLQDLFSVELEIVQRLAGQKGFVVQPRRWVVERSLAWYARNRRLSKDYEHLCTVSETMVYIASIQLMLKRLCPDSDIEKPYRRRNTPRAA
jgi:putative transposase